MSKTEEGVIKDKKMFQLLEAKPQSHSIRMCRLCHKRHRDQQLGQLQPSNGDKNDSHNDTAIQF